MTNEREIQKNVFMYLSPDEYNVYAEKGEISMKSKRVFLCLDFDIEYYISEKEELFHEHTIYTISYFVIKNGIGKIVYDDELNATIKIFSFNKLKDYEVKMVTHRSGIPSMFQVQFIFLNEKSPIVLKATNEIGNYSVKSLQAFNSMIHNKINLQN